jgi:hypothetical protein
MTVFAQSSRTLNMAVFGHMTFKCLLSGDGKCYDPGTAAHYRCDSFSNDGTHCWVHGREILAVTQGIGREQSYWDYFGYLCAIYVAFKIAIAVLTYYPWPRLQYRLTRLISSSSLKSEAPPSQNAYARASNNADTPPQQSNNPQAVLPQKMNIERKKSFHADSSSSSLCWTDFSVILPKTGAKLVDNVSGHVKAGRILALMGPSGAGSGLLYIQLQDLIILYYGDVSLSLSLCVGKTTLLKYVTHMSLFCFICH